MENFIVSARKYRPATFETVIGQKALTEALRNAITQNHLAHAYLFCGPRGVGKTTCARIFAKTINCLTPHNSDACNECESCRAFDEQRSFNIHELDAASNNTVDDIHKLIEQTRVPPQLGRYSVFIIDEVHMLTSNAFNALLKTLEEPPSYVIFILATTDKHKVIPTILSRCQVYDFARITIADTVAHLQYVARQEGIQVSEEALNIVAQKADGGMRDALSIFDQLVAYAGNNITYEQAAEILNVLNSDYYFRLVDMALQGDVANSLLLFNEVLLKGFDAPNFVSGLSVHIRNVLMSMDQSTVVLIESSDAVRAQYATQAHHCSSKWLFSALDILNTCGIQYKEAKNKRLTIELALIKLCNLTGLAATAPNAPTTATTQTIPTTRITPNTPTSQTSPTTPAPQPAQQKAVPSIPTIPTMPQMPNIPNVAAVGQLPNLPTLNQQQSQPQPAATTQSVEHEKRDTPFTVEQFENVWRGLSGIFKQEERLVAMISQSMPRLTNNNRSAILTLANPWQKEEFKKFGKAVMNYVRDQLKNDYLTLTTEVAEYKKEEIAYTDEEKYKLLVKKNPGVQTLKEQLNLYIE